MSVVNGPKLRELREGRNLNFVQLAGETGINRRTLVAYERKELTSADVGALRKLAQFFGVVIEDLITEEADLNPPLVEAQDFAGASGA